MAQKHGQQTIDEINRKIIEDGLKPTSTVFLTQKEYLRQAIDECAVTSSNFDEFQSKLLELFQISVIEHLGRYSYLHPDRPVSYTHLLRFSFSIVFDIFLIVVFSLHIDL